MAGFLQVSKVSFPPSCPSRPHLLLGIDLVDPLFLLLLVPVSFDTP